MCRAIVHNDGSSTGVQVCAVPINLVRRERPDCIGQRERVEVCAGHGVGQDVPGRHCDQHFGVIQ